LRTISVGNLFFQQAYDNLRVAERVYYWSIYFLLSPPLWMQTKTTRGGEDLRRQRWSDRRLYTISTQPFRGVVSGL